MYEVKRKKKEQQRLKLLKKLEARKTKLKSVQEAEVIQEKLALEANLDERRNADLLTKERDALKSLARTADSLSSNNLTLAVKAIFEKRHAQEILTLIDTHHQARRKAVKQATVDLLERKRVEKLRLMESGVKSGDAQLAAMEKRFKEEIAAKEKAIEEDTKKQQAQAAQKLEQDQQAEITAAVQSLVGARAKVAARRASRSNPMLGRPSTTVSAQDLQARQEIVRLRELHEVEVAKLADVHHARLQKEQAIIQERLDGRLKIKLEEMKTVQEHRLAGLPEGSEREKAALLKQFKQDRQRVVAALKAEKDAQMQKLILRLKRMRNQAKQQLQLSLLSKMEAAGPVASAATRRRSSFGITLQEQLIGQNPQQDPIPSAGQASVLSKLDKIEKMLQGTAKPLPKAGDKRLDQRLEAYEGLSQMGLLEAMVDLQTNPLLATQVDDASRSALLQKSLAAHVELLKQRLDHTDQKITSLNADAARISAEIQGKESGKLVLLRP